MNTPLTTRERAQLDAALVLLKRGEVELASRVLDPSVQDTSLPADIRAFMKSCEPVPKESVVLGLSWTLVREDPEKWIGEGPPNWSYLLVGNRNGNYSVYREYFHEASQRNMIGLVSGLGFYLPYEKAKAACEKHFLTVMQPAVPAGSG